ncbi:hypothetical protein B0H34DRAFT_678124 [Crassisporium funariophilum]|nr:hypothetical protein B0H34DRAFT_678124 [Crassisporium funariophilum]
MQLKALSISFAILSSLTYGALGAPVQLSQLIARDHKTVQSAIHNIGPQIGHGNTGTVHALKDTYNGHQAVVKIIAPGAGGGHFHPLPGVEAHNAHQAGQLLGHGHDAHTDTHFLVMKHMGDSAEKHGGLSTMRQMRDTQQTMAFETSEIPESMHNVGLANAEANFRDQNGGNFVYHNKNGATQAEVIDWAKAEHLGTHPKVAAMPVEHVHHTDQSKRKCPTCTIQ